MWRGRTFSLEVLLKMRDLLHFFPSRSCRKVFSRDRASRRLSLFQGLSVLVPKFFGFLHSFDDSLGREAVTMSSIIIALLI